ncbi:uncharacterized protein PFL1_01544 [Pseudozyma flocculosa PF-1]|uniref:uncharacterized protein n=1 Tax=Pseudozyma flocculosa PF-1 TaxID=1277687 RepID=UPI00045617F8|nr:uncharacterized protein PFL1_01544 [Pseudozyma flocculosa PF-1]EPQ30643.1 hypothetical protein PFL1_01544 [Pseudozyma flocculosa PF-1]
MSSSSSSAMLVPPSGHLDQALATIRQAALDFVTPDPQARARGEATFLALRHSDRALEYACYALQHVEAADPLVLFQSLNALLYVLPSLPLHSAADGRASLAQLRDFVLSFAVSRGPHAASSWPQYLRSRAHQTAMAVEKRLLGLELAHCASANDSNAAQNVVQAHVALLTSRLAELLTLPSPWPSDPSESAAASIRLAAGLGLIRALVDEFVLTPPSDAAAAAENKDRGKAKAVEPGTPVGLSVLEHRWCKAVIQNHVLPALMSATFQLLYGVISTDQDKAAAWRMDLFPQAVSAVEKLLDWSFLLSDPFANFGSPILPDQLDDADDQTAAANASGGDNGGRQYIQARKLPSHFVDVLMPTDVVSLLATAYGFGLAASASTPNRDLSFSVHRLRQCLLLAFSYVPAELGVAPATTDVVVQRVRHLSATLQSLVQEECGSPSSALLSARGNAMLFLAQAFQIVINANSVRLLAEALGPGGGADGDASGTVAFLAALSQLGRSIFGLAFHRPRDTDEEDDLAVLAEDTTDTLLSCWQVLLGALYREADDGAGGGKQPSAQLQILWQAVHGSIRDEVFHPYVTGRLQAAAMPSDGDGDDGDASEHGEAAAKDRDIYSDQLITIAGLGRLSAADNLRTLHQLAQPLCQMLSAVAQGQAAPGPQELEKVWEQAHWLLLIAAHLVADEAKGETAEVPSAIAGSQEPDDPAVGLIVELGLNLVQTLSSHGARSAQATSPQVTETLLWFVARWTSTYLLIDDHSGFPTNAAIQRTFSGDAGRKVLAFLLQRLRENLELWMSDSDVLVQLAAVVSSFTRSSGIMLHLLQLPEMESLVSAIVSGLDALPANTHGPLVSAVVSCIYSGASYVGQHSGRTAESYFAQITASIEARFGSLLQRADFAAVAQRSDVIAAVQTSLDMLDGLAASVQPNSADAVYGFLSKFFPAFSHLCRVYETRPEVSLSVVKVLHTLAVALELDFGAEPYMVTGLNAVTWQVLEALKGKTHHSLMVSDGGSPLEDEAAAGAGADDATLSPARTADVALFGFESLIVLLDAEPLGVPRVRRGLAKLVSNLLSLFSDRIVSLAVADAGAGGQGPLENVVTAITLILTQDEAHGVSSALEALTPFSRAVVKTMQLRPPPPSSPAVSTLLSALDHLTTTLLRLLLLDPLDSTLVDLVLTSLRSLVMARTHLPPSLLPAAQEGFSATLQNFIATTSLTSSASSRPSSTTVATGTPSFLSADEPTRRQALGGTVEKMVGDALASLRPVMEDGEVRAPWLYDVDLSVARTWQARERGQVGAFVERWRGDVARCRATVRVR